MLTLKPVRFIGDGEIHSQPISFSFGFQQGMDPASFHVSLEDNKVIFSFYGQTYSGGSADAFLEAVRNVTQQK
jgi:hypothetical protein